VTLAPILPPLPTNREHALSGLLPALEAELAALDRAVGIYADQCLRILGESDYEAAEARRRVAAREYRKAVRDFANAIAQRARQAAG
jgi:hypothetical protein